MITQTNGLAETYQTAKKQIIAEYLNSIDDALFSLYCNTPMAESFTEAVEIVSARFDGISQGSTHDVALATRFWAAGRACEDALLATKRAA